MKPILSILRASAAILAALLSFSYASAASDAKIKNVEGSYQYYVPRHVSRAQAEQTALERAMIEALAREFGTIVQLDVRQDMRSSKNGESVDFYSSASSLVKGEWVETTGQPEFGIFLDGDDIVVTCSVRGRAREIKSARADLDVKLLRNSTSDDDETSSFLSGDKLMLSFTSPIDGYITVYLEGQDKTVFRMLPFYGQKNTTVEVKANTRYVFFATSDGDSEQYQMTADGDVERNIVYVVFSPNEYVKPIDRSNGEELSLQELSSDAFRSWVTKTRALDPEMQIIVRPLTVTTPIND